MSKVRFQILLEEDQRNMLRILGKDLHQPVAEIIRQTLDGLLADWKKKRKKKPFIDRTIRKLISTAGICRGGGKNLADNHDRYL